MIDKLVNHMEGFQNNKDKGKKIQPNSTGTKKNVTYTWIIHKTSKRYCKFLDCTFKK